jgi:hypothetical protein
MCCKIETSENRPKTIYQILAEKFNTSPRYVGQVVRGERRAIRGLALEIKNAFEKLNKFSDEEI